MRIFIKWRILAHLREFHVMVPLGKNLPDIFGRFLVNFGGDGNSISGRIAFPLPRVVSLAQHCILRSRWLVRRHYKMPLECRIDRIC